MRRLRLPLLAAAMLALAAIWLAALRSGPDEAPDIPAALFTTLPILWPEVEDVGAMLDPRIAPHWVLDALGGRQRVRGLDMLADAQGRLPLAQGVLLVMAQPRPLSPQENVALDDWVRSGGRVLLFADPMLTAHTIFPLGDRRRPQDVVLLSPILARWGLQLRFDEQQPAGEHEAEILGTALPVNLPGSFAAVPGEGQCELLGGGLGAQCRVGQGHVLALADAALLEEGGDAGGDGRRAALTRLRDSLMAAR